MSIYDVVATLADDERVCVVRRDGYAVCHVCDCEAKHLKEDWKESVVLWSREVLEVEKTNRGLYLFV